MRRVFLPRSLEEFWEIVASNPGARLYAGGTDLLVKLRACELDPPCLVCLERVEELQGVREQGDHILIGGASTHVRLLENQPVRDLFPVLAKGISVLGSPPIRHMGTIGGNIVTASPSGDTLPALYVLSAEVEVRSVNQHRRMAIRDFILGPGKVDLAQDELLTGIRLNKCQPWNIHHYEKVGRRKAQACAVVSMAAVIDLSDDGTINAIRLAWGGVGPTVVTSADVEAALTGTRLCAEALQDAARVVERAVSPISDIRAGADYRRTVAGALLMRLLAYEPVA